MKKIAISLSVILNAVVLAVAAWLSTGAAFAFIVSGFIQPAHERWVSQFAELDVAPSDTVFLGDSITEGGSWHELFPATHVRNRGIGGDVTVGVLARIDQVREGRPAQVFLLIGTNDLAFGVAEADIVANIAKIVDEIHSTSPHTEIFVQSVLPRAVEYREQVESLNRAIEPAIKDTATWVDLYPIFLDADGSIKDKYSNDELHLHGAGYIAWRDVIKAMVNTR